LRRRIADATVFDAAFPYFAISLSSECLLQRIGGLGRIHISGRRAGRSAMVAMARGHDAHPDEPDADRQPREQRDEQIGTFATNDACVGGAHQAQKHQRQPTDEG
jgi:hypothetical protein